MPEILDKYEKGKYLKKIYPNYHSIKAIFAYLHDNNMDDSEFRDFYNRVVWDVRTEKTVFIDPNVIKELSKYYPVYIVSDSSKKYLEFYLGEAKINKSWFAGIYSNTYDDETYSKIPVMKRVMNETGLKKYAVIRSIFDIPTELFIYLLVFFILGFLIYAFVYSAIGSVVSRLEDVSGATMPVTYFFMFSVIAILISMFSVENTLLKVISFIQFTSPMAMFTRIAMSAVPWYEILISMIVLVASVIGIGLLSAKIYKVGVLLYGVPPKISAVIKAMKK